MNPERYTCPCCGYQTFEAPPGSYSICPVCFWEDDAVQLLEPDFAGGANEPSLLQAQANFEAIGACDKNGTRYVRAPKESEPRDPSWRAATTADVEWARARTSGVPDDTRLRDWYYWTRDQAVD